MICGIDEAGRGPVLGPMVIAAVMVEDDSELRAMGVKDSKRLTASKREGMFPLIEGCADVEVRIVTAEEIDRERERMSLNRIELEAFAELITRLSPDTVYADCPDPSERSFGDALSRRTGADVIARHRADDTFPVVSAASIVAKVTRDRAVASIAEELGTPVGSGYPSDPTTIEFIEQWINSSRGLPPYVRRSWDTSRRLLAKASMTRLDEWE